MNVLFPQVFESYKTQNGGITQNGPNNFDYISVIHRDLVFRNMTVRPPGAQTRNVFVEIGFTVRVRVTLRLAVCSQSVRIGDDPLETHEQ
jgi:hypothetical protein